MNRVQNLRVRPDLLYQASGWSTLVTDVRGRIAGDGAQGYYFRNTRLLHLETITVDGDEPVPFSTANIGAHAQLSYAEIGDREAVPVTTAYLLVERFLGEGLRTRLRLVSYAGRELRLLLRVRVAADFADTAEAQSGRRRQRADVATQWNADRDELLLRYLHEGLDRAVAVRVETTAPVRWEAGSFTVDVTLAPRSEATVELVCEPVFDGERFAAPPAGYGETATTAGRARQRLAAEMTRLAASAPDVTAAWHTAVADLAALPLGEPPGPAAPIAGLPAYQEIFGRDTMTASWQAMLAGPTMLADSLRLAAAHLGRRVDNWRDEEPGKPLHQGRHGPLSVLGDNPFDAYYGDWSTGPDFLIFLAQYFAWTGDLDLVRELMPAARRVLTWIERYGDPDRDGFLEYASRSRAGLRNQGWKDSDSAVVDHAGRLVDTPLATSELQAYWYAALRHAAVLFAATGHPRASLGLLTRAAALRRRFQRAYWMPDEGCYAMALGPDKRQVRSVNSNDGQLLACGIVPARLAPTVARRLFAPDMFSGWGVRTLSSAHPAYNPFSYHRGSVWPVEAGTIGLGLARYGCRGELHRLAEATFSAAALFDGHRLPEVFGGLPRTGDHPYPGVYPDACSPQAWSASAPIALVQALLTLRPAASAGMVLVDPHLPPWLSQLRLEGVRLGRHTFDLAVRRRRGGRTSIGTRGDAVRVVRAPTRQALTARRHR